MNEIVFFIISKYENRVPQVLRVGKWQPKKLNSQSPDLKTLSQKAREGVFASRSPAGGRKRRRRRSIFPIKNAQCAPSASSWWIGQQRMQFCVLISRRRDLPYQGEYFRLAADPSPDPTASPKFRQWHVPLSIQGLNWQWYLNFRLYCTVGQLHNVGLNLYGSILSLSEVVTCCYIVIRYPVE